MKEIFKVWSLFELPFVGATKHYVINTGANKVVGSFKTLAEALAAAQYLNEASLKIVNIIS